MLFYRLKYLFPCPNWYIVAKDFIHEPDAVILATGYKQQIPKFLDPIKSLINWDDNNYKVKRNYSIDNNNTIFVQNADLHSHSFNSADLGLGAYRNGIILNAVIKSTYFVFEKSSPFKVLACRPFDD